jgi:modified peptide precursor CbpA
MVKGTPDELCLIRGFFMCKQLTIKEAIMKKERIISYRRRCRQIGTGLSHYILIVSKTAKK